MAKHNVFIENGFRGKLGPVVGSSWKGMAVVRSYNALVRNPRTEAQQLNRARFGLTGILSRQLSGAIGLGLGPLADASHSTVAGCFMRLNLKHIGGTSPDALTVDCEHLQLSDGPLAEVWLAMPDFSAPCRIRVRMFDGRLAGHRASLYDHVVLVAYCNELGCSTMDNSFRRTDEELEMLIPAMWQGRQVHVYCFVLGGSADNSGLVSATAYVGSGTAA